MIGLGILFHFVGFNDLPSNLHYILISNYDYFFYLKIILSELKRLRSETHLELIKPTINLTTLVREQ